MGKYGCKSHNRTGRDGRGRARALPAALILKTATVDLRIKTTYIQTVHAIYNAVHKSKDMDERKCMVRGRRFFLLTMLLFFMCGCPGSEDVDAARSVVAPINPAGVEKLVEAENCPIIISIMTSRCSACRQELPVYQKMHERYHEEELGIFVVSIDFGTSDEIQAIVDRMGLTYPVFWGGERVMRAFDVALVPYKIIIQNGAVVETLIGAWSEREIEEKIVELMETCDR